MLAGAGLESVPVIGDGEELDLAVLMVPAAGWLAETGNRLEPYQLVDPAGVPVPAVSSYFRDLQAAGRTAATVRSYGMDLLRWFRFLWAAGVRWDHATRAEARDFCRWLQAGGKPGRPQPQGGAAAAPPRPYAAAVRAHSETVLRGFYDFHLDAGTGPIMNPFPLESCTAGRAGSRSPQPDGAVSRSAGRALPAAAAQAGSAQHHR